MGRFGRRWALFRYLNIRTLSTEDVAKLKECVRQLTDKEGNFATEGMSY
ncbi:MAG: hypothetical protein U0744_07810 [Gemmataceae bacterium]